MTSRIAAMASIADDAIEQVRYGKEHARWLAAAPEFEEFG